jgi:hypothetical protein
MDGPGQHASAAHPNPAASDVTLLESARLIQQHNGAQLPATGHWQLHRASFVGISSRRATVRLSTPTGWLSVADPPEHSSLTLEAISDQHWFRLSVRPLSLAADSSGFSRWRLAGTLDDDLTRHDIELTLPYHGVHRRADTAWAWFTGRGATRPAGRWFRRRADTTIVLDLLFHAPR